MACPILIIGQGPSKNHNLPLQKPFDGPGSGTRLAELFGVELQQIYQFACVVNLLDQFYGKDGKGDSFPLALAKQRASSLRYRFAAHSRVLLIGSNVAKAFGVEKTPVLTWTACEYLFCNYAIVPHPSGINRWYNAKNHTVAAQKFLRKIVKDFSLQPI